MYGKAPMKLFACRSSQALAEKIAEKLGIDFEELLND